MAGFTDTFDTSIRHNRIIDRSSMQGQLLDRVYHGDRDRLDRDLRRALAQSPSVDTESDTQSGP